MMNNAVKMDVMQNLLRVEGSCGADRCQSQDCGEEVHDVHFESKEFSYTLEMEYR